MSATRDGHRMECDIGGGRERVTWQRINRSGKLVVGLMFQEATDTTAVGAEHCNNLGSAYG